MFLSWSNYLKRSAVNVSIVSAKLSVKETQWRDATEKYIRGMSDMTMRGLLNEKSFMTAEDPGGAMVGKG